MTAAAAVFGLLRTHSRYWGARSTKVSIACVLNFRRDCKNSFISFLSPTGLTCCTTSGSSLWTICNASCALLRCSSSFSGTVGCSPTGLLRLVSSRGVAIENALTRRSLSSSSSFSYCCAFSFIAASTLRIMPSSVPVSLKRLILALSKSNSLLIDSFSWLSCVINCSTVRRWVSASRINCRRLLGRIAAGVVAVDDA